MDQGWLIAIFLLKTCGMINIALEIHMFFWKLLFHVEFEIDLIKSSFHILNGFNSI